MHVCAYVHYVHMYVGTINPFIWQLPRDEQEFYMSRSSL